VIDSYQFGHIIIDGIPYTCDVLISPAGIESNWRRKEGHMLQMEDIQKAIEQTRPKSLVVGTGKFGIMKVNKTVEEYLDSEKINLYAEPTGKAIKIYNRLLLIENKVLGAFHLTC
jgi:hypothetical protein